MTTIASTLKYACVDTPIDFTKFLVNSAVTSQNSTLKSLQEKISLLAAGINFAEIMGYTHEGWKKLSDLFKAQKHVVASLNFIPTVMDGVKAPKTSDNSFNSVEISAATNYSRFTKDFCSNLASVCHVMDKFDFGFSKNPVMQNLPAVGAVAGGISSTFALADEVNKMSQNIANTTLADRGLKILASTWGVLEKITLVAVSALSIMSLVVGAFVAVPTVPTIVMPVLLVSATVFGLFNKYVNQAVKPAVNPAVNPAALKSA